VYPYGKRMTGNAADAEEVLSEGFLLAWRGRAGFHGQARPSTWLYRVTFNAALMRLRTRRRKGADSLDALATGVAEAAVHRAYSDQDRDVAQDDVVSAAERKAAIGRLEADFDRAIAAFTKVGKHLGVI
jgi:RNA polymerase sigma factor (sigma-70 family)